jgi:galactonate dehydratase
VHVVYPGRYKELVTPVQKIKNEDVFPMKDFGLSTDLHPSVYDRSDLAVRCTEA